MIYKKNKRCLNTASAAVNVDKCRLLAFDVLNPNVNRLVPTPWQHDCSTPVYKINWLRTIRSCVFIGMYSILHIQLNPKPSITIWPLPVGYCVMCKTNVTEKTYQYTIG